MKIVTYIVTRHGSNAANQTRTGGAIVGTVEGPNVARARQTAELKFHCYNNQYLTLYPASLSSQAACINAFAADREWEANEELNRECDQQTASAAATA